MYMEKDCYLLHYYACATAVLLLIATPPSPPRTTPLFSNTTLFVICYALCAAYLSASAAEILPVCAMLIAAGYISAKIRMQMESEHRKNISSAERTARLNELNALLLTVRDHGMGILPEKQDTLFSGRAIPRDDSRHGLGIGLSICKTIVNAHHGRIWAENCADGGAEFNFTLPLEETDG